MGAREGDTAASPLLSDVYNLDEVLANKDLFEAILAVFYNGEYEIDDNTTITTYDEFENLMSSEEGKSKLDNFLNIEYNITGEFVANGYEDNNLKHEAGVISMARSDYSSWGYTEQGYNSAGCQFFITTEANSGLDGLYAAFGKVIEGMDIVEEISNLEVYYRSTEVDADFETPKDDEGNEIASDTPKEEPVIKSITVETYGVEYDAPVVSTVFDTSLLLSGMNY